MLRWICAVARKDRIRKACTRRISGPNKKKIMERKIKLFRHVYKRPKTSKVLIRGVGRRYQ